eukprot:236474_1
MIKKKKKKKLTKSVKGQGLKRHMVKVKGDLKKITRHMKHMVHIKRYMLKVKGDLVEETYGKSKGRLEKNNQTYETYGTYKEIYAMNKGTYAKKLNELENVKEEKLKQFKEKELQVVKQR